MEDPSFSISHDEETGDLVLGGMGELHLEVLVDRLRSEFDVKCNTDEPQVAYREALGNPVKINYKHVKQTGGHGQYAHVIIEFEPNPTGELNYSTQIKGGSVPTEYFAAIRRGIADALEKGPLAGYPVLGVHAILVDGKHHEVDSSDMAFRAAAAAAMREALQKGQSRILEPVMKVEINTPDEYIGDIVGYLGSKRGRVGAMRRFRKGAQKINAEVPLSEMFGFATPLRTMSSGRASFSMEFASYKAVPPAVQQEIIKNHQRK